MYVTDTLAELAKARRSHYKLGRNSPVPDERIEGLVKDAILHIPSSFNTQSTRIVVLLHKDHEKAWDLVLDAMGQLHESGVISEQMWTNQMKPKLESTKAAYGTVRARNQLPAAEHG
jgi:uncharacterized protein